MKRLSSSGSLGALISIFPTSIDEHDQGNNNHVYTREFQSMLDGLDEEICLEESSAGHLPEKKRRLSVKQVKALEKNFEVENKLEPERKVKLAQELGLQPRQVAVWFQNRRARWKTKQLERDYGVLKASFDSLKHNYDSLKQDNQALTKEIRELEGKLQDNSENKVDVKEEEMVLEEEEANALINSSPKCDEDAIELNLESFKSNNGDMGSASLFPDFKDGSSDSDSSAILNDNRNSPSAAISSSGVALKSSKSPQTFLFLNDSSTLEEAYQEQFVKIEEHDFFSGEETCSTFFTDDQAPTLHWYNAEY